MHLGKAKEFKKIKIIRYEESVYYAKTDLKIKDLVKELVKPQTNIIEQIHLANA